MDENDFNKICAFLEAQHRQEADTIQMRATRKVVQLVKEVAEVEFEAIDASQTLDTMADILCVLAQPYRTHEGYDSAWDVAL